MRRNWYCTQLTSNLSAALINNGKFHATFSRIKADNAIYVISFFTWPICEHAFLETNMRNFKLEKNTDDKMWGSVYLIINKTTI